MQRRSGRGQTAGTGRARGSASGIGDAASSKFLFFPIDSFICSRHARALAHGLARLKPALSLMFFILNPRPFLPELPLLPIPPTNLYVFTPIPLTP